MAVFNEPTKWQTSLVNSGDANTIPQSTPVGTGEASFEEGFPQITQVPIGAGGQAPDRKDFNGLFKLLGDWSFYQQNGGIASYSNTFDYAVGSFVKYNNNFYRCIQANGVSSTVVVPDSGTEYWQRLDGAIGEIKWFAFNTAPDGYLVCNGANVSRTTYADLFNAIGTTFGSGDGSTTFALPNLIDKFVQGSATVGTVKSAGLPNITGKMFLWQFSGWESLSDGAISNTLTDWKHSVSNGDMILNDSEMKFNASKSNGIYGNSTTVQPPALTLLPCIKY